MKGYKVRRKILKLKSQIKINDLYDEYHRIDIIMKGRF